MIGAILELILGALLICYVATDTTLVVVVDDGCAMSGAELERRIEGAGGWYETVTVNFVSMEER
jgi:hypothetical protein